MTDSNVEDPSSVMESACDDEELFFGPITDQERLVKERFEKRMQEKGIILPKLPNLVIDDVSEDSIYESFSTESKYDSFDDSLYGEQIGLNPRETDLNLEEVDLNSKEVNLNREEKYTQPKEISASNFLSEQVTVNNRRQLIDKKSLAGHFCDSLEDIHSLVSSADKLSLSEEIEDINIMEISHTCDDSLMNDICIANKNSNSNEPYDSLIQDICIPNKNSNSNEQYFDEDSLAILDHEKAFDDSLEDSNGPSISHVDSLLLSKSKGCEVDSLVEMQGLENRVTKSYFETSIDVIYENSKEINTNAKNLNLDSPSISERKNLFRDSLEEISELSNHNASFNEKALQESENLPTCDLHNGVYSSKNNHETNSYIQASDTTDFGLGVYKVNLRKSSSEFLKPLDVHTAPSILNFNETICIEDSILPSSDVTLSKSPIKNKDSEFGSNSQMAQNPSCSNDTICIDDSLVSESTFYSFSKYNSHSKYDVCCDDLGTIEVEKSRTINPNSVIAPSYNDTICIEDSMIEASNAALNSLNISALNVSENKCVLKDNIHSFDVLPSAGAGSETICDDSVCILPLESTLKEEKLILNKTISIDDSIILPSEPTLEREKMYPFKSKEAKKKRNSSLGKTIEIDFQKLDVSDIDREHNNNAPPANLGSPVLSRNTVIDIVVRSPLHECQKKSIVIEHDLLKDMTKTPEKVPTIVQETLAERNLKLHIEVAVDKDQGINLVSVSSVDQCSSEKCASPHEDNKVLSGGDVDKFSELKDQAKVNISYRNKRNYGLKSSVIDSPKNSPLGMASGINEREKVRNRRHSGYFSVDLEKYDANLLQALDLHDTSCNLSQGGPVQSRDSIMPLNLCTREKLFEKRNNTISRNESKENIPFIQRNKFNVKERNIPSNQKSKGSPKNKGTPQKKITKQQLNNINDVKRSGGKVNNSATKIPVRKIENTPASQKKKPEYKPISNSSKPIKNLFVTPACPSAASQKEVPGETPKKNHHFCMVRNSISKVPKSAQKVTSKKFQNIQSPIAQYIGNHQVYPPLKTTHHYDGNIFSTNVESAPQFLKTAKNTVSTTPGSIQADKKF